MERDLDMAREVQLRLMPPPRAAAPARRDRRQFLAARSIGGDVYDFLDYGRPHRARRRRCQRQGRAGRALRRAGQRHPALARPPASFARGDAGRAQRPAAGAQARLPIRHHAHGRLGRQQPDPADRQRRLGAAALSAAARRHQVEIIQAEGFPLGLFPTPSTRSSPSPPGPATSSSSSPTASSTPSTPRERCSATSG